MAIYNHNAWTVVRFKVLTSDEIHIITTYLHLNYAEYGLQK